MSEVNENVTPEEDKTPVNEENTITKKTEEIPASESAPKAESETVKAEETKTEPQPAKPAKEEKPLKKLKPVNAKKKIEIPWAAVGKTLTLGIFCVACGLLGGVIANYTGWGTQETEMSSFESFSSDSFSALPFGDSSDNSSSDSGTTPFSFDNSTTDSDDTVDSTTPGLGITVSTTTDTEGNTVVYIVSVSDSCTVTDGELEEGDIIVSVDGTEVTSSSVLSTYIRSLSIGDEVTLVVERDDEEVEVTVELVSLQTAQNEMNSDKA